ncbi:MAG: diaminopropionate ammonia-lyase [Corynebacterium sp.]|uniref:diaminopropionate ammonia-lyase n=1 Tax=unclassified Corynebacterium TaxID=2624378 RepID=UPI00095F3EFD|nr:diaminopropionate ammonia-lyase [Corynebacterium sp. CNJ-954]OLT53449.1 PLP-dependent lyase/thiolase [Corynebacterium sp. CNJ-954]
MTLPDNSIASYLNPAAADWRTSIGPVAARSFHESMDGYRSTTLREIPELAAELNVARVFVKDESDRLGLPAFKILGASWAVCCAIAQHLGVEPVGLTVDRLRVLLEESRNGEVRLVTATDGNHGRAVSHMARLLGVDARIYIPKGISQAAADAISAEGAQLIPLDLTYDDVVEAAADSVAGHRGELLIQDTSWSGYVDVPRWIIEGYMTMFDEIADQLNAAGVTGPDLVACPVGVGSLAQAMVEYYRGVADSSVNLLSVEPATAACILQSLHAGSAVSVDTSSPTMMAGLNCGTPTDIGWPSLREGLTAAVAVDEDSCRQAVLDFRERGQDSGPCGAASLAGVRVLVTPGASRDAIELGPDSIVVLVSTEGTAANPLPEP